MSESNTRPAFVTDPLLVPTPAAAAYLTLCGHALVKITTQGDDYLYLFEPRAKSALRRWEQAFAAIREARNRVRYEKQGRA